MLRHGQRAGGGGGTARTLLDRLSYVGNKGGTTHDVPSELSVHSPKWYPVPGHHVVIMEQPQ